MADFHKDILGHHPAGQILGVGRPLVVMEQILGNPGALRFPVAPDAHGAMVDMVAADDDINGGMEFDPGDFCSAELLHIIDMVDMVVFNDAEHPTHPADNSALFTMVDVTAANDMATDLF